MATNKINQSISGVYGGHLLQSLRRISNIKHNACKETITLPSLFTDDEERFIRNIDEDEGNIFLSIIDHKESLVRLIDTPHKKGIVLTVPKVLEIVETVGFYSDRNGYEHRNSSCELISYKFLDVVSFIKETACNIIEFISTREDMRILGKLGARSYYSSRTKLPKVFSPLLSSRYEPSNFARIAQHSYFNLLKRGQKTQTQIDVRSEDLSHTILRNELAIVRNEKHRAVKELEV